MFNLEESLREFCKSKDGKLFEEKLYEPLTKMANYICTKRKITKREFQDGIVSDMVSVAAIQLPQFYDETKGLAKNSAYILMNQYLLQQREYKNKNKRNYTKTFYIEDMEHNGVLIEIEFDELKYMKSELLERKKLFEALENPLYRTISSKILECIEKPELYECVQNSYIKSIAKKAETNIQQVYAAIKEMRKIIQRETIESFV